MAKKRKVPMRSRKCAGIHALRQGGSIPPSPTLDILRPVCLAHWRARDDDPQGAARGILHELVMDLFKLCGVGFEDREDAAQIAKEIAYNGK